MKLRLESETIGRTGGITGAGAKKVLGAPHIDSLEVVVREAVQNSWDASEGPSIDFGVRGFEFKAGAMVALKEALGDGTSGRDPILGPSLPSPCDGLLLWDKGTSGLGGGMRADEFDDGRRDFVRFVYMIGDTKVQTDTFAKGGTYGFGRSSFLNASKVGTILVHTACQHRDRRESRFIGMTWTDPDVLKSARHTGRHWWGERDGKHVVPLVGRDATRLAQSLGMNVFSGDELGTAILILQPRWSSGDDQHVAARARALSEIRAGLLWNCWPRLLDGSIRISIDWFGEPVAMPDPRGERRLKSFTRAWALSALETVPLNAMSRALECQKPIKKLGRLTLVKVPYFSEDPASDDRDESSRNERNLQTPLRHIAMMRGTRLVIHYVQGPVPPEGLQYAGVFVADEGVDAVLAASEPPAHDEWVKERLAGQDRTLVSVTYKRVHESIREFLHQSDEDFESLAGLEDLGMLSDYLGDLFVGLSGDGAGGKANDGGGNIGERKKGGGRGRVNVTLLQAERILRGEIFELCVPVRLQATGRGTATVTLAARAVVMVEGGAEREPPEGALVPEVIGWQLTPNGPTESGPELSLEVEGDREVFVRVSQPRDCRLKLVVEVE